MFKLSTYNCCSWWHVPIAKDHQQVVVEHINYIPPPNRIKNGEGIPMSNEDLGCGTEINPFVVRRRSGTAGSGKSSVEKRLRFVCVSDTHNQLNKLNIPDGDVFLHCGDAVKHFTSASDLRRFNKYVGTLPHPHKLFISGNHCVSLDPDRPDLSKKLLNNMTYLQDESVEIEGVRIYGTPWRPKRGCLYRSEAFGYDAALIKDDKWAFIPPSIDILMTHGPPYGIRDYSRVYGAHLGCPDLLDEVIERIKPRIHLFGHVHDCYGASLYREVDNQTTAEILFVNLAIKNGRKLREPVVIDYIY